MEKPVVGDIYRLVFRDGSSAAFSDCIVVEVDNVSEHVDMRRPYVLSGPLIYGTENVDRVSFKSLSNPQAWVKVKR